MRVTAGLFDAESHQEFSVCVFKSPLFSAPTTAIVFFAVLAKPGVPPVMVLSKMFPELTKREQEELTLEQYNELVNAKAAAVEDR